jgi:hypothetical protein
MTALLPSAEPVAPPAEEVPARRGFLAWLRRRGWSLLILAGVLSAVGFATGWNLQGWPGRVNDDEGTYVAEAWAVLYPHHLSHYTYWYDHPPFGWIQMAGFIGLTDGFARVPSAVMAGRQFMWLVTMITSLLIYVLCRRLGFRRLTAAVSVLMFGLSPLAIYYHRMVSLDNIGVMWFIATLACAASRRRSLAAAFGSAVCMAGAVLSKETVIILLPVVLWVLWQHTDKRTRRWHFGIFGVTLAAIVGTYPLFALLRGELLPGPGHVSLGWALWWQFFGRAGSGSLLDPSSGSYVLVHFWVTLDPWLMLVGVALVPAGLAIRWLRPLAFGMLLQIVVMVKGGYLPYFYVTSMLPFAALLIGGFADQLLDLAPASRPHRSAVERTGTRSRGPRLRNLPGVATAGAAAGAAVRFTGSRLSRWYPGPSPRKLAARVVAQHPGRHLSRWTKARGWSLRRRALAEGQERQPRRVPGAALVARPARGSVRFARSYPGHGVLVAAAALICVFVIPNWWSTLSSQSTVRGDAAELAATAWVEQHIPKKDVVVTDDYMWPDLKLHGMNPLWLSKIDTDPQVMADVLPHGYKSIQYIVLYSSAVSSPTTLAAMPTMAQALDHSVVVRSFGGGLTVRRVIDNG